MNTVCVDVGTGAMLGGTYATTSTPDSEGQSVVDGVKIIVERIRETMQMPIRNVVDIDRGYNLLSVVQWLMASGLDIVGTVQRKQNFPCTYPPFTSKPGDSQVVIDKAGPRFGKINYL